MGFNNRFMLDALRAAPADTVKFMLNSSVAPCVIVPADDKDNFLYLIMGVRIRPEEF